MANEGTARSEVKTLAVGERIAVGGVEYVVTRIDVVMFVDGQSMTIYAQDPEGASESQLQKIKSESMQENMMAALGKMFKGGKFPGMEEFGGGEG